jgi:excinuclease ABC subunit B
VLISTGDGAGGEFAEAATIGHNFEAVISDMEARMRAAAADLDFEEAARLRDEIKRLRTTELAVIDDPTAKFPSPSPRGRGAGRNEGAPPPGSDSRRGPLTRGSKVHKPALDEMGIALYHEIKPARPGGKEAGSAGGATGTQRNHPRKPSLDEMGPGVESVPAKDRTGPRSTLGRPGMRGGWKPSRRR